jgi:hypothetical protein
VTGHQARLIAERVRRQLAEARANLEQIADLMPAATDRLTCERIGSARCNARLGLRSLASAEDALAELGRAMDDD